MKTFASNLLFVWVAFLGVGCAGIPKRHFYLGQDSSFFVSNSGKMWAWGDNRSGKLGIRSATARIQSPKEVPAPEGGGWESVAVGESTSIAISKDGKLYKSVLRPVTSTGGTTESIGIFTPVEDATGSRWVAVAAGARHFLALNSAKELYAWGQNGSGQLGVGAGVTESSSLMRVAGEDLFKGVAAGPEFTIAVTEDGRLMGWGRNAYGILGDNTPGGMVHTPKEIGAALEGVRWNPKLIAAGITHALAVTTEGRIALWGSNEFGQTCDPIADGTQVPLRLKSNVADGVIAIAAGGHHTLFARPGPISAGDWTNIWGCGRNDQIQLGRGLPSSPQAMDQRSLDFRELAAGTNHSALFELIPNSPACFAYFWGDDEFGQIGNGPAGDTGSRWYRQPPFSCE